MVGAENIHCSLSPIPLKIVFHSLKIVPELSRAAVPGMKFKGPWVSTTIINPYKTRER